MKIREIIKLIQLIALCVCMLTGCSESDKADPSPTPELPISTSADVDAYVDGTSLRRHDGEILSNYTIDVDGNIVNDSGDVVVTAANAAPFTYITTAESVAKNSEYTLKAYFAEDDSVQIVPMQVKLKINISPADAINRTITIESNDPGAVFIPYDANKTLLSAAKPSNNEMASVTFECKSNPVEITVIGNYEGVYTLTMRNVKDEEVGKTFLTFEAEDIEKSVAEKLAEQNAGEHTHEYEDTVVESTFRTRGYTLHICKICGYSFRDTYTPKKVCTHDYDEQVIEPTYTSGGYTIYTCKYCGETKRGNETPVLQHTHTWDNGVQTKAPSCTQEGVKTYRCTACNATKMESISKTPHNMAAKVIAATETSEGYTRHYCTVCGYETAHTDIVPAIQHTHNWDNGTQTKAPSCTQEGVKTYRCTTCNATRTESIPKIAHSMTTQIIAPTEASEGYTRHYCTVCGYETAHTDIVPAIQHTHSYISTVTPPTCTEQGYSTYTCTTCGHSYTGDTVPSTGHAYSDTVVPATWSLMSSITVMEPLSSS